MNLFPERFQSKQCIVFSSNRKDIEAHDKVSEQMKLAASNEDLTDILYINCSVVGTDTSLLYLFMQKIIDKYQINQKDVAKLLPAKILNEEENIETLEEWEKEYSQLLNHGNSGLQAYGYTAYTILGDLMDVVNKKYINVLVDNTSGLKLSDKTQCNGILYGRGSISMFGDHRMHLKINNTLRDRRYFKFFDHKVEKTHDYSGINVDNFLGNL